VVGGRKVVVGGTKVKLYSVGSTLGFDLRKFCTRAKRILLFYAIASPDAFSQLRDSCALVRKEANTQSHSRQTPWDKQSKHRMDSRLRHPPMPSYADTT